MKLTVPEEVWLFAKGPSFDAVKWHEIGAFRVSINDVAFHVGSVRMMFANDTAMQDKILKTFAGSRFCPMMVTRNNRLRFPFHLQHDATGHGTAGCAVNVLSDLGARKFHMIGFDSYYGDYSYSKLFDSKPQEPRIYGGIISYIERLAKERKLELIFYGKEG